jgi:beta-galactosidase
MAYEQFDLKKVPATSGYTAKNAKLGFTESAEEYTITGKDFTIKFDIRKGILSSYVLRGRQLIGQGPTPGFWRAPTDNDIGAGFNKSLRPWRNAYMDGKIIAVKANRTIDGKYEIRMSKRILNGDAETEQVFTISGDGSIHVDNRLNAIKGKYPIVMRVGNDLQLNSQLDQLQWYGRGPWENYWDRKTASIVGLYKQTLQQQYFSYARPQESGNKTDVRWITMTDKKGTGLKFMFVDSLLSVSALPYSTDDLDPEAEKKQYHSGELNTRKEIYMHVDLQQIGLQGMDSWGGWPLEQYRLPFKNYQYSYWIQPLR